ncbi:MAG: SDR family NAD(P)-dependent oxidoreductase [Chloroflexota bacterium]|nr:SDR family NAD(P)-dependent oxidoreductase [Chloroflexota bacterium]
MSHHDPIRAPSSPSANGHALEPPAHGLVNGAQETSSPNTQVPVAPPTTAVPAPQMAAAPASVVRPDATAVIAQFQQVMSHFLETQRAVMLAYLGGTAGTPAAPVSGVPSVAAHPQAAYPMPAHAPQETTATAPAPYAPPVAQPAPVPAQPAPAALATALAPPAATPMPAAPATITTAAAAAPTITREVVSNQLLAIIAERTGYPPEMLGLDLDLEADLGIDSIKRVEILGTFRQHLGAHADQSEAAMEELAGLKTLRGIIEWAVTRAAADSPTAPRDAGTPASVTNGATAATPAADGTGISRSTVRMLPAAPPNQVAGLAPDGVLLVTDDGWGIAAALAERFGESGIPVALVKAGTTTAEVEPGIYSCVFESAQDVQALAATVRARQGAVAGIIHLLPLRPAPALDSLDLAKWRERLAEDVAGLFHLAQAVGSELHAAAERGGAAVLAVTGMGGAFGLEGSPSFFPGNGGVAGLAKTLALEWPDVRVRAIDLDPDSGIEAVVGHLLAELYAADTEIEIGYFAGGRSTPRVEPAPVTASDQEPLIAPSSVILLTGGARGITAEVALDLAQRYQPILLLAGRSPQPTPQEDPETASLQHAQELKAAIIARTRREGKQVAPVEVEQEYRRILHEREMRETLQAIEETGATVRYFSVDMRDENAVRALLDDIYRDYGRLDGVVHGAGIIEDKLIEHKDPASFRRVFETKTDSAFLLARLLRFDQLRFLVFFSSVSGRFGNRGQGDYAAANEVLNKLAGQLDRTHPGRVVAINWGPWATGGMVSPELERQFAACGVLLIPRDVGVRMFDDEVHRGRKGEVEVVVTGGTWLAPCDQEKREPAGSVSEALPTGAAWVG